MNKKGFTLIELLAVVIIMLIIGVIAIMKISDLIDDSQKKALIKQADVVLDIVRNEIANGADLESMYIIDNNQFVGNNNFDYNGKIPNKGSLLIEEDEMFLAVTDGYWCAKKFGSDSDYTISKKGTGECELTTDESCFTFNEETGTIEKYNALICPTTVFIPSKINGIDVKTLGVGSFTEEFAAFKDNTGNDNLIRINDNSYVSRWKKIKKVIIPDTVNKIEYSAFYDNEITDLVIPDSVINIESSAFKKNKIKTLKLSNNLDLIGYGAFSENNIEYLSIDGSMTTIQSEAFSYNNIKDIKLNGTFKKIEISSFNNNLIENQEKAFIYDYDESGNINNKVIVSYAGKAKQIVIPEGVEIISERVFQNMDIESVLLPSTLIEIGSHAFSNNQIKELIIPKNVSIIGYSAFSNNFIENLIIPSNIKALNGQVFAENNISNLTIEEGVNIIGSAAFYNNNLTYLYIPASVSQIYGWAFESNKLSEIRFALGTNISSGGVSIGAFYTSSTSNPNLSKIIYSSSKLQNWKNVINGKSSSSFITGTVTDEFGKSVVISSN